LSNSVLIFVLIGWLVLLAAAEAIWAPAKEERDTHSDQRLITNFSLTALALALGSLLPLANLGASWASSEFGLGLGSRVPMPWLATCALLLLAMTFVAYWVHRAMHRAPLLWRVHRVHHADTEVDVSTSLRNHPLELAVSLPASAGVILLLGPPVSAVVAVQTAIFAATLWQHAAVALPHRLDRMLARVLVTPRVHRLHHHPDRSTHDSNYGEILIIWDLLFGTFNREEHRGPVGLVGQRARPNVLIDQICSPLRAA
jgi:sterol desaturase/sphingolipid hydroxylase (fatty acid hydroxylase superfamily)